MALNGKAHQGDGTVKVLVIGSGVMGLTTARELQEKGYGVIVLAKDFPLLHGPPKSASEASGALCVLPEMIQARQGNDGALPKLKVWSRDTRIQFLSLCSNPGTTGVSIREIVTPLKEEASLDLKELQVLPGFYHSPSLLKDKGICSKAFADAYSYFTPVIDPRLFMVWLFNETKRGGAQFVQETLKGLIKDQVDTLKRRFGVQFIVNCTGLGSAELAGDKNVYPLRGALVLIKNDGSLFPKIDYCVDAPYTSFGIDDRGQDTSGHLLLIIRGEDKLALGSFYQPDRWDTEMPVSYPPIRGLLKETSAVFPALNVLTDSDLEVTVGFRPGRRGDVRLEQDPGVSCLIHNYGHGRYGMSLSYGCAKEVTDIIDTCVGISYQAKL